MSDTERHTTEAEEMYLITIARAIEDGAGPPVSVSTIADALDVSSVSANQMVKKLGTMGYVTYVPYKGVGLTPDGERLANVVLRSRRLWGVFLVDHLGFSPRRADELACEMEHVAPDELADRLSSFLGDPTTGPQGRLIPGGEGHRSDAFISLSDVPAGTVDVVVEAATEPYAAFLASHGIEPGSKARVIASGPDGSVLLEGPSFIGLRIGELPKKD